MVKQTSRWLSLFLVMVLLSCKTRSFSNGPIPQTNQQANVESFREGLATGVEIFKRTYVPRSLFQQSLLAASAALAIGFVALTADQRPAIDELSFIENSAQPVLEARAQKLGRQPEEAVLKVKGDFLVFGNSKGTIEAIKFSDKTKSFEFDGVKYRLEKVSQVGPSRLKYTWLDSKNIKYEYIFTFLNEKSETTENLLDASKFRVEVQGDKTFAGTFETVKNIKTGEYEIRSDFKRQVGIVDLFLAFFICFPTVYGSAKSIDEILRNYFSELNFDSQSNQAYSISHAILMGLKAKYPDLDAAALFSLYVQEFREAEQANQKADKKHDRVAWAYVFAVTAEVLGRGVSGSTTGQAGEELVKRKLDYFSEELVDACDQTEISRVYRQYAKKFHPDLNQGSAEAEAKMKALNNEKDWLDRWCARFGTN